MKNEKLRSTFSLNLKKTERGNSISLFYFFDMDLNLKPLSFNFYMSFYHRFFMNDVRIREEFSQGGFTDPLDGSSLILPFKIIFMKL